MRRVFLLIVVSVLILHLVSWQVACANNSSEYKKMAERFAWLQPKAAKSILVHVHIPKAGGTALSDALSTECKCAAERKIIGNVSHPNCRMCRAVQGTSTRMPYSMSRDTGWRLGVHPPLAIMRYGLGNAPFSIANSGITPVYIILLRNPYDRFLSETTQWMNKPGQTVDWSIVNEHAGKKFFYRGISSESLRNGSNTADREGNVKLYAGLPAHFILHNRQVKTVGGSVYDFDMYFDPQEEVGSRWRHRKEVTLSKVAERAFDVISKQKDIIFGLSERFGELICILEILYGRLYRFNWDPAVHSHSNNKTFDASNATRSGTQLYQETYDLWAKSNAADEKFYFAAEKLFEVQFTAALDILRSRVRSDGKGVLKRTPHCKAFLS